MLMKMVNLNPTKYKMTLPENTASTQRWFNDARGTSLRRQILTSVDYNIANIYSILKKPFGLHGLYTNMSSL